MHEDTISAIATAVGEGGVGIVRVSGEQARVIAKRIFVPTNRKNIEEASSHTAIYGQIIDPNSQNVIDEGLLLQMYAPHSYTCEDVVEFQCHGGVMALQQILRLTLRMGARLAEPGEFTKRAFLNGRLDLTQSQAVIDIIRAKTDASLRMAVGHLEGQFSKRIHQYRFDILRMIAHLEAAIDFPEDDIDEIATDEVEKDVIQIRAEIDQLLTTTKTGRVLREGLETAIIGKPNVGKSSLLNALLNENRAIVTDIPGTTRDSIEEYANIGGIPLKIIDTAGIRATDDLVEQMGVEKARAHMDRADLILAVFDQSRSFSKEDEDVIARIKELKAILLVNKSDLAPAWEISFLQNQLPDHPIIQLSTVSGNGMDMLKDAIVDLVYQGKVQQGEGAFVNSVRQEEILRAVHDHLNEVLSTIHQEMSPDFIVIDLRAAWEKLGEITGDTVNEDIIDQIFSQFCIGK